MSLRLSELLSQAGIRVVLPKDPAIASVAIDSRKVKPGCLFLALQGAKEDGFAYVEQAVAAGAAAVLYEGQPREIPSHWGVPALNLPALRPIAAPMMHALHDYPGRNLFNVGVTGTNGKTTITRLTSALLGAAGYKPIRLGTIDYAFGDEVMPSPLTTPDADIFFDLLSRGLKAGCTALAMEVSSHALSQDRIRGIVFQRAIFTNLTQDHLDFHADFEDYFAAKRRLFTADYLAPDGIAVLNADSPYGLRLKRELAEKHAGGVLTFTREKQGADLTLESAELKLGGSLLRMRHQGRDLSLSSALVGAINVENLLAATAFGLSLGLSGQAIDEAISKVTVPGRNELFPLPNGAYAVVDYAHTPDALERVLASLRPLTTGKLICVFGCGGDRDKGKRPLMGGIAARLADLTVVTSDNPRTENPQAILDGIVAGISDRDRARVIADRREAIALGLKAAQAGDCVLIAGKGHEDYQILGTTKHPFSDQGEVRAFAAMLGKAG